ncbi:MAG: thioredoxin family protein [Candidatus Acidiferrum sp.]
MKVWVGMACVLSLSLVTLATFGHRNSKTPNSVPSGVRSPVVVELFTSEGCSSCPPADTLLSQLEELQPVDGAEVIALEEHVDYWNHLGWADPFSSSEFTARQQSYADSFGQNSVYTPEMIVDGGKELVGSRSHDVRVSIAEAARQPKIEVKLTQLSPTKEDALQFAISTGRFGTELRDSKVDIWVAVTERRLHSDVKRGENAGEDLHHAAVVRSLRKIGTAENGKESSFTTDATVSVERSWKRENILIVAFVQERKSRRILGAAMSKIL